MYNDFPQDDPVGTNVACLFGLIFSIAAIIWMVFCLPKNELNENIVGLYIFIGFAIFFVCGFYFSHKDANKDV